MAQGLDSFTGTTDIDWEDAEMYVPPAPAVLSFRARV